MMIPDHCGTARPRSQDSSREVAADRVLDLERVGLPLGPFAAAQPRLGRRPPPAAILANKHDPPPALDDMAQRPQIPGGPSQVQRLVKFLLEPVRSASGKAARTCSTHSDSSGPVVGLAPLTPWFLASRSVFSSGV
jgi:hypothetical protein